MYVSGRNGAEDAKDGVRLPLDIDELLNRRSGMRTLSIKEGSRSSLYTLGRSRQLS